MPALAAVALAALALASPLPHGFRAIGTGPRGGTIWRGLIRNSALPGYRRETSLYLPPGFSPRRRYPVVYLLHGMPGSPWSYTSSLSLADLADSLIARHPGHAFVAVMPVAGPSGHYEGEWTGVWERYVVRDVVPWVDSHLPTIASPRGRTIAGLSAGGFGAIDIGLRHPRLFGRIESWGGYFRPLRDGPLRGAGSAALAAHDPSLLVRREARLLRRLGMRFFLSSGPGHGRIRERDTVAFARELRGLRLPHRLRLFPSRHREWEAQLTAGLRWWLTTPST